jgi:hypothetical protein
MIVKDGEMLPKQKHVSDKNQRVQESYLTAPDAIIHVNNPRRSNHTIKPVVKLDLKLTQVKHESNNCWVSSP